MANKQGDFIWYELITTDAAAAAGFYAEVIGWTAAAFEGGVEGYEILTTPQGGQVGGLMSNARCPDVKPGWLGYVAVEDVDSSVEQATQAGGAVQMPPTTIEGVGRMAMVTEPSGAPIYLMRGASDGTSDSFNQAKTGHGNWNELSSSNPDLALDFYGKVFGWTRGETMPMGPMGDYQIFHQSDVPIGGTMQAQPGGPLGWTYYFGVEDIEATAEAVTGGGGQILHGPAEVPGGAFIVIALDPQGARFGAVGPKKG